MSIKTTRITLLLSFPVSLCSYHANRSSGVWSEPSSCNDTFDVSVHTRRRDPRDRDSRGAYVRKYVRSFEGVRDFQRLEFLTRKWHARISAQDRSKQMGVGGAVT